MSTTRLARYIRAPRSRAGTGTDLVGLHENLPPGVSPADNELGWSMSIDKLARLVEHDHWCGTPNFAGWRRGDSRGRIRCRVGGVLVPAGLHQVVGLVGVRNHTSKNESRSWPETSS
jgi:hypothetical protein